MKLLLSADDYKALQQATEILDKYSRIYVAMAKEEAPSSPNHSYKAAEAIRDMLVEMNPN